MSTEYGILIYYYFVGQVQTGRMKTKLFFTYNKHLISKGVKIPTRPNTDQKMLHSLALCLYSDYTICYKNLFWRVKL